MLLSSLFVYGSAAAEAERTKYAIGPRRCPFIHKFTLSGLLSGVPFNEGFLAVSIKCC